MPITCVKQTKSENISVIFDFELQTWPKKQDLQNSCNFKREVVILVIFLFAIFQFWRRKFEHDPFVILPLNVQFLSAQWILETFCHAKNRSKDLDSVSYFRFTISNLFTQNEGSVKVYVSRYIVPCSICGNAVMSSRPWNPLVPDLSSSRSKSIERRGKYRREQQQGCTAPEVCYLCT